MHFVDGCAHFIAIMLMNYQSILFLVGLFLSISFCIFSNIQVFYEDMPEFMQWITILSGFYWALNSMLISIYGLNRCPDGQQSELLYKFNLLDDNQFTKDSSNGLITIISVKFMALIALLLMKNPRIYKIIGDFIKRLRQRNQNNDEIQLQTISTNIPQSYHYFNEVDLSEESDDQSMTTSFCHNSVSNSSEVEIDTNEESDPKKTLSIVWTDMTLKVEKTFYSSEKLILRGIKGFIRFGTMTALMGPSGAGKTSLLKSLNGMYRNLMTKESKIYLSKTRRIRTCFIAQDQREHIIAGLTVKQTLLYASKIKNCRKSVDHYNTINDLMEELSIIDIKNSSVDKCSSGQQKRIVMAMELTSILKPNLICVDEPTSGVDSHSALLVSN